jgi:hypothetical protein
MSVIQMQRTSLVDYSQAAGDLTFNTVPFSKITALIFIRTHVAEVQYKCGFEDEFHIAPICRKVPNANRKAVPRPVAANFYTDVLLQPLDKPDHLPQEKIADIKTMLPFMPVQDQRYFETLLGQ